MTFTQSGSGANANINTLNDVRGDQHNTIIYENVTLTSNQEQTHPRANLENTMQDTIGVIQKVAGLVPIEAVKAILTDIATILLHLQEHTKDKDKDSLIEPTRSCRVICATLAFSAKGASIGRIGGPYGNTLSAFRLSVTDLRMRITRDSSERERMWGWFSAKLDVKYVNACTAELGKAFKSFSKDLNIIVVNSLEQISDLLQRHDIPNLFPDPPPPSPAIFFGREELLRVVSATLLRDKGVALIGPGGIGKSTLARAVLNEEDITEHYRRRFFISYSGMNPKTITFTSFLGHMASVLGLQLSGAGGECQIMMNLGLSSVLVVLDNAETFEDAVDRDEATRISDFIAHIAGTDGVTIMLTSRTSSNARRVSWTYFDVPPLEREPARLSFREIYHNEIADEEIDELLAAVDFHPLSVSIIAYTARESRWSARVLLDRWNSQRNEFLQSGDGKDNLGFTIRLSLESPSIEALGQDALRVLCVISFFPQGINRDYLTYLFPSLPRISSITDTLCKLSLIYVSTPFLTMLAPIRLFLETLQTTGLELLKDIRTMYYRSLEAISPERNSHAELLLIDHLNIEYLVAFDIALPPPPPEIPSVTSVTSACRRFLLGLKWHKPRHTTLYSTIRALPEQTTAERVSKGQCLFALGCLFYELSNFHSVVTVQSIASTLFIAAGMHNDAAVCMSNAALACNTLGYFSRAQQLLHDFIDTSREYLDGERMAGSSFTLDWSRMHSSSEGIEKLFLCSTNDSWHRLESRVRHWQARMHHGRSMPEEVLNHLESIRTECMSSDVRDRWAFLGALADSAFLQRKFDIAFQLLDQAQESVNGNFSLTTSILTYKAAVASSWGDYDLSRSLSQRCIDTLNAVGTLSSTEFLRILYIQGRNELYVGDYSGARRFLADVITHSDSCGNIEIKAFSLRALGEVTTATGSHSESNGYFSRTTQLCKEGGIPPELLGVCEPMMKIDDNKFPGWKQFLDVRTG